MSMRVIGSLNCRREWPLWHSLAALRQQEGRQPLARGLASQQQHLFLRRHKFVGRDLQKLLLHQREIIQKGAQRGPWEPAIAHMVRSPRR